MQVLSKISNLSKKKWLTFLLGIILTNVFFYYFSFRIDLTEDKKFTLSNATTSLIKNRLDKPIQIDILLSGEMPSQFQKLALSVERLLREMKRYDAAGLLTYRTFDLKKDLQDSTKQSFFDTLYYLGIRPTTIKAQLKKGEGTTQQTVFPAAVLRSGGNMVAVSFLSESLINNIQSLNDAEALLEYKFAHAIERLSQNYTPIILYSVGHGEPLDYRVYDLLKTASKEYAVDTINLSGERPINKSAHLLLINNPAQKFTEIEKLKIDQFLMQGGNLFMTLEMTNANLNLLRNPQGTVVTGNTTGLEELLFHYGVRVNTNLVQDLFCDQIPIQIGWNGDKPQFQFLPWYFFPLLTPNNNHVISKNLDPVQCKFGSSMDTIATPNIRKTFLLTTSNTTRIQSIPSTISLEALKLQPDATIFNKPSQPLSVLLEGKFLSPFKNVLIETQKKTIEQKWGFPLKFQSSEDAKLIVSTDGDLFLNSQNAKQQPLEMGMNNYNQFRFGNKSFLTNALQYLTSASNILEARKKSFTLRALDRKKIEQEKTYWQYLNLLGPLGFFIALIFAFNMFRYRRYYLLRK